jgi:hypothetical protein
MDGHAQSKPAASQPESGVRARLTRGFKAHRGPIELRAAARMHRHILLSGASSAMVVKKS